MGRIQRKEGYRVRFYYPILFLHQLEALEEQLVFAEYRIVLIVQRYVQPLLAYKTMLVVVSVTRESGLTDDFILVVQDDNGEYTPSVLSRTSLSICAWLSVGRILGA